MSRYRLTRKAQADLEDIWDYTAERWSADQAETYIRQLAEAVAVVAADPTRGRACDDIRAGYRKYAVNSHVLFYRMHKAEIEIVRILHRRMDFERHL